jgi:signal peptidase I
MQAMFGIAAVPARRVSERIDGSTRTVQYVPALGGRGNFGPVTVPADHYFMLGDNRDDSEDSRYIGAVPREKIIGRAHHLIASANIKDRWQPRFDRFGSRLE